MSAGARIPLPCPMCPPAHFATDAKRLGEAGLGAEGHGDPITPGQPRSCILCSRLLRRRAYGAAHARDSRRCAAGPVERLRFLRVGATDLDSTIVAGT